MRERVREVRCLRESPLASLASRLIAKGWVDWLDDRGLFALVLGIIVIAAGGMPEGLIAVLAVVLALLGLVWSERPSRLTRA